MTEAGKLIESLVAAFKRGDIAFIIAHVAEDCSPFRETQAPELPYAGEFKGRAGATAFFDAMLSVLEPSRLDIDRWVCAGEDVVAIGSWGGKARATGKSWERSYGAGGGGCGTFIVHMKRWRLPRGPSQ
jgi:ketosteroid isomerase-like protein